MNYKNLKTNTPLRAAINRVKWMKKSEVFSVRALWSMINYVEHNGLEGYWDYKDEFSDDQLEMIEENGREGYYSVYEEISEHNWDYEAETLEEQRKELISDLSFEDFLPSFISQIRDELSVDEEIESDDEIFDYIIENFNNVVPDEEFHDLVREYQSFELDLDSLMSNTKYDKCLTYKEESYGFIEGWAKEEFEAFQESVGVDLEYPAETEEVIFKWGPITDLKEIIEASEIVNAKGAIISFDINHTYYLKDDDGEEYEWNLQTTLDIPADNFRFEDSDEYVDSEWATVFDDGSAFAPTEDDKTRLHNIMCNSAPIDFYGDSDANVQAQIDEYYIIEAVSIKDSGYKTFGYLLSDGLWVERNLYPIDITTAEVVNDSTSFQDVVLTLDGRLEPARCVA